MRAIEVCAIGYRNALDMAAQYSQSSEASLLHDTCCSQSNQLIRWRLLASAAIPDPEPWSRAAERAKLRR